jgi:solute carrier family 25 phosphate transporter 23/24/25/41
MAGITSVTFTYPLDIVRTRLSIQTASFSSLTEVQRQKMPGMWATMVIMYKSEGGLFALYRGIIPTVAGVAPYVSFLPIFAEATSTDHVPGWPQLHDV